MSYSGFAGYHCHSQLSLMTANGSNSVTSSCCPTTTAESVVTVNSATSVPNMSVSINEENQLASAASTASLSPSSSSVCALTSPYESRIISSYPRLTGLYGSSYSDQNSFYNTTTNPFYPSFGHAYDLKDANCGLSALQATPFYHTYGASLYNAYGDRYSAMDSVARRKNVTRDSTTTLKAWLNEHRKNPYPTKGEKIMLAIITKMTLTQVSTWFANARRRLKKENKMTWEPRNKSSDGYDSDDNESCKDSEDNSSSALDDNHCINDANKVFVKKDHDSGGEKLSLSEIASHRNSDTTSYETKDNVEDNDHSLHSHNGHDSKPLLSHNLTNLDNIEQRPKIWSLAQTAMSESPPYSSKMPAALACSEWTSSLPASAGGVLSLFDYPREYPQASNLSATSLRKGSISWPEEHCVTNCGASRSSTMQLFTPESIGHSSYLHSHSGKPATSGSFTGSAHHHHSNHSFSPSIPHLT